MNRRDFLAASAASGGAWVFTPFSPASPPEAAFLSTGSPPEPPPPTLPDLAPARWIWYPSGRTLANTFVLFRHEITLRDAPRRATGWISADSRYRLEVNGQRIQWGPAPADPRWPEADPLDLTACLRRGLNVVGATVLFYGYGDGTWPLGKPGFLFWLEIEHGDGTAEVVVSDARWKAHVCRAWRPGHAKRWYLRALQEEFDTRRYPHGWSEAGFNPGPDWLDAMVLQGSPNKPALSTNYYEYMLDVGAGPAESELRARSIPLMQESWQGIARLAESSWVEWRVPPVDYFDFRVPDAFRVTAGPCATLHADGAASPAWKVELAGDRGALLTFELREQIVGWPAFTIEAPEGTTVELLVHEAHASDGPPLLNTHFDSWTRLVCRAGVNRFETFDFESLRWMQLHIHGAAGTILLRDLGVRRRVYPWPRQPAVRCSEPDLQRLFDATINTLHNCAQETLVDGMARERQQYSGDCGHQLHAIYLTFGETRQPARYLSTFSQGMTKDGYFLDCWPAYDRLARLVERQLDLSGWGPILDHGVGFNFDCWHHYLYTGDLRALREPYPRLLRFAQYLHDRIGRDGLLPVENLGIPSVWIDHVAYRRQRHKQCAFNLYAAAMFEHALAPLAHALGDRSNARNAADLGRRLRPAAVRRFWSRRHGLFVNNLPWLAEEKEMRTCDRSLATAVLFAQCPGDQWKAAVQALAECPAHMGLSYPANAGWRLWALARHGRADVIVQDLRTRWATMPSVKENLVLQEDWVARHDSGQQWSHCAVVPLYITQMGLAGIRPLAPGFERWEIRPQLADLEQLELTVWTPHGPIEFACTGRRGMRELCLGIPRGGSGELVVPSEEELDLKVLPRQQDESERRYALPAGGALQRTLRHV